MKMKSPRIGKIFLDMDTNTGKLQLGHMNTDKGKFQFGVVRLVNIVGF